MAARSNKKGKATYTRNVKKPIQRSLLAGSFVLFFVVSILLGVMSYFTFSSALYSHQNAWLDAIITHVENNTDADDLRRCLETGKPSEKYEELQRFLNGAVDDFGLTYLYIVIPSGRLMVNACSATSEAERAAGEEDMPLLSATDAYTYEQLKRYRSFWEAERTGFFREYSDYGVFYTACRPLRDSNGETVALICADIPVDELRETIARHLINSFIVITAIFGVFLIIMIAWLRRNVTGPIRALENSAREFAGRSHRVSDIHQLRYKAPALHSENELLSLSNAIDKMTKDMRSFVEEILSMEKRAMSAENAARVMTAIAYKDSLTHVKNKAAYSNAIEEIRAQIALGYVKFAVVMVDINDLKYINDNYGHEKGDRYLVGACSLVCKVYKHSPVYRVGGDEFVVILRNEDYENRESLFTALSDSFCEARMAADRDPWDRYSAAGGMAEYRNGDTFDEVFKRADDMMYTCKQAMKAGKNAHRR